MLPSHTFERLTLRGIYGAYCQVVQNRKRNLGRRCRRKTMSVPPDPVVHSCREDQIKIPHYDEILLLTKLEEDARKVGVNTNQAVRALNTTLIKKQSLEEKTLRDLQQACREIHALRDKINKLLTAYYGN